MCNPIRSITSLPLTSLYHRQSSSNEHNEYFFFTRPFKKTPRGIHSANSSKLSSVSLRSAKNIINFTRKLSRLTPQKRVSSKSAQKFPRWCDRSAEQDTLNLTRHPRCIMFFFQYFSIPLSVSFYQCFILIPLLQFFPVSIIPCSILLHPYTTDTI